MIDEKALLSYASSLRGELPCILSPKISVGHFNLVRKIQFDDGVSWVVRLRMPPIPDEDGRSASAPDWDKSLLDMQSELSLPRWNLCVPMVYGYNLDARNAIGCPFSIIEYIDGNTAEEVSRSYPGEHEGIPAQFQEKFWRQIAKIMIQLASTRLPQIGSITQAGPETFVVGHFVETGTGPYNSAASFYADYPLALSKSLGEQPIRGQEELVQAFCSLASSFSSAITQEGCESGGDFGLANYDLNPNNVLVDREFNVLAVIDWDSVIAVPDAALYRFPFLMGVSCAVPGVVDTHPAVMRREQLGRRFAHVVEEVGRELAGQDWQGIGQWPMRLLTKSSFFSKEAVAFRSLTYVKMRQDWVNSSWLQGLEWLSEQNESQVAQFYLGD